MHRKKRGDTHSQLKLVGKLSDKLRKFAEENSLSDSDVLLLLDKVKEKVIKKDLTLPISIFDNKELSCFETICKYVKEDLKLSYHKIGELLNRNERTIWVTYQHSCKKRPKKLHIAPSRFQIPISVIKDRSLSVLESITVFLKTRYNLSFAEIASLLNKSRQNIWTVYDRAQKKKGWKQ